MVSLFTAKQHVDLDGTEVRTDSYGEIPRSNVTKDRARRKCSGIDQSAGSSRK